MVEHGRDPIAAQSISDISRLERAAIAAEVRIPFDGVPEWIQWMPAGTHTITGSKLGKPFRVRMQVDRTGAEALQATLEAYRASDRRKPWFDFNHEEKEASAWPLEFAWRDGAEQGIWVRVEWSDRGRAAIAGKEFRSFSPMFYETEGDPAKVDGAPLNMGGLTNKPAFHEITPIWASEAAAGGGMGESKTRMEPNNATELAALQSQLAAKEAEIAALKAQDEVPELKAAVSAKEGEVEAAKKRIADLEQSARERQERDAETTVQSAVARGAIGAKDEATQNHWRKLIIADAKNAELLGRIAGKPALETGRIVRPVAQVIQADTSDVLRAFISAATPRDKGVIYMRDIAGRITAGENVMERAPVKATNTLGTLASALVSQRALELVVSKRPMLRGVVMDFSDEVKSKDDTVKTRTLGLPTVQNFGGTVSPTADTDVTVTLDLFKEVRYTFTAAEIVGSGRNLVAERGEAMALALGNGMVDALAALITETNFGTVNQTIKATAGIDYSTITAIKKAMNTAGVPDTYRFGWVNADVAEALQNDEIVMANYDKAALANAYAHWTNVVGFNDIWEFPALPANSVSLTGFFASRSALIVAARVPRSPTELTGATYPGVLQVVTDPVTGLSVLRNDWIEGSSWETNCRLVALYGVDLGQASCGHTLVSAA